MAVYTSDNRSVAGIYKELFNDKTTRLKDGKNEKQTLHKVIGMTSKLMKLCSMLLVVR